MTKSRRHVLSRVSFAVFLCLLVLAGVCYLLRYTFVSWYLDGDPRVRAAVISEIDKEAPAAIEKELHMSIPQSILSFFMRKRGEEARERDALKDTLAFTNLAFESRWLRFRDVHRRKTVKGFALKGSDVALAWVRGGGWDVLVAFRVDIRKKKASAFIVNENSGFFADLRQYVDVRARRN